MKRRSVFQRTTCQRRAGWTLIETMLFVTLTTVISVMGAKVIMLLIEVDGKLAASTMFELTTQRFEDQFRTDVELSLSAEISDDGINLSQHDGNLIAYLIEENRIVRTSDRFQTPSREAYRFPDSAVTFSVENNQVLARISSSKSIATESRSKFTASRQSEQVSIRAIIGRQLRHSRRLEELQ